MKTKHIIFSILAVFAFASVLIINACKKDVVSEPTEQNTQISQEEIEASKAMSAHILEFKERMEYFKQNPGLKSVVYYLPQQAVIEVEAALSFTYCYSNIETNDQEYTTTSLIMPLENGEISENDLSLFQEDVIDELKAHMAAQAYPNKKLKVVDLEYLGDDGNGDALVGIISLIANQQQGIFHTGTWWYGYGMGDCYGNFQPEDATTQLIQRVTEAMLPAPPSNCRWYFTSSNTITHIANGTTQLDPSPDNYCDYKLFYAEKDPPNDLEITDTERCLSPYEMDFYTDHYSERAAFTETLFGQKFDECVVYYHTQGPYENPDWIEHKLKVTVGNRYLECTYDVKDIRE